VRILLDENIPGHTEEALRAEGHDVFRSPLRAKDEAIVTLAESRQAILVTRDRDFLNFLPSALSGIVVVRIHPSIAETITQAVRNLLDATSERWLQGKILILRHDGFEIVR